MNGDVDVRFRDRVHSFFHMPQCLILAQLAGNPRFEDLVIELENAKFWGANAKAKQTEWPKLVKYLREEVQPIV